MITLSVVSHGQTDEVARLLASIAEHAARLVREVILTENLPAAAIACAAPLPFELRRKVNAHPRGFASNHNAALRLATGEYFAILNPDLVFAGDVLTPLIGVLERGEADIIAPVITDDRGNAQDSFRGLPTPMEIIRRRLLGAPVAVELPPGDLICPDWIAGMFLLARTETFRSLGGLDERYHLYFEDVDFGCRARLAGLRLAVLPSARVIHKAQRRSWSDVRYFLWHLSSAVRFFTSPTYQQARRLGRAEAQER